MAVVRWGLVGLGGYAGLICDELLKASSVDASHVRFVAAAEPDQTTHAKRVADLGARGVKVCQSIDELLHEPIDAVWLPVPIHLHRAFTEKAAAAGKAIVCEKPAAGCLDDVPAMIAARDRAVVKVAIAFQDIYRDDNLAIKQAMLDGEIGQVQSATVHACWPRGASYFHRNAWAGALKRDGVWVLDSPANNALAHNINLPLFLLGQTMAAMGQVTTVEAELYRVNPIENYDTCSLRVEVNAAVPLLIHFTHATQSNVNPIMRIQGSGGRVDWEMGKPARITRGDQTRQVPLGAESRVQALEKLNRWIGGDKSVLVESLEMAAEPLKVVNAASEAALVRTIDPSFVRTIQPPDGDTLRVLDGIEQLFGHCSNSGKMIHETAAAPWSVPAARMDTRNYRHFAGPRTA